MSDRGTSTTLSYVLTLSIATVLVGGLIVAGSTFVKDNREQVIRQELQVVGEHVASNIQQVDRYAVAAETLETGNISQHFPSDVTGSTYDLHLVGGSDPTLYVNSTAPAISVNVDIRTTTDIGESDAGGGTVLVTCTGSDCDEIEITNG